MSFIVLLPILLTAAAVAAYFVYDAKYGPQARQKKRIAALVKSENARGSDSGERDSSVRRRLIQSRLKEMENTRQRSRRRMAFRRLVIQAGLDIGFGTFIGICVALAVVTPVVVYFATQNYLIAIPSGLIAGFGLPQMWLKFLVNRRTKQFTKHFADAIDVIVRGIKSGLPVAECMRIIGREAPEPVGGEFRQILESQRLGMTLEDALLRAVDRMPTAEIQFFAVVLIIQAQTGGNLAETLGGLSNVLRGRKKLADTIQSKSAEAKSSAAIIGSLPFFVTGVLYLLNPDYMTPLFKTTAGNYMIMGGIGWMSLGVLIMRQMISFKV